MIRKCTEQDFDQIWTILNDGAQAYKGVIPADRFTEPYMSREKLQHEIDDGILFWCLEENGTLAGVMGIQAVKDVSLIRHAYVRTADRNRGVGTRLLQHLLSMATTPILIGTWAAATWAIRFYERHGFRTVGAEQKDRLLKTYWNVPDRQIETSIVLADQAWRNTEPATS